MHSTATDSRANSGSLMLFAGLVLLAFIYREWVTIATPIHLFYDEAYYLSWAQTPDWGYYSKPPMVAWVIALTTGLFGNAEWAVKLGAPLLYSASALLVYFTAGRQFNPRAALYSGVIFLLMPLVSFNSLFITTDAPLLFFWCAATYALVRALENNLWRWWLLAGICGGLGLMSKYTFILFPVGLLSFMLFSRDGRPLMRNPRFWVTCFLALSLLLPNLWWNYQNDFISFQHTAEISHESNPHPSLSRLVEFLTGQMVVFGPVFAVLLIVMLFRKRPHNAQETLLWNLLWPTLAVLSLQAFLARANINWAAPTYVAASLLAGYHLARIDARRWFRFGAALNLVLMLGFYHYAFITDHLGIVRKHGSDPYKRITGWSELVHKFQPWFDRYPDHKLASGSRRLLAYFGYYLKPQDFTGVSLDDDGDIEDQYELNYPISTVKGKPFLFITDTLTEADLHRHFAQVRLLTEQKVEVYSNLTRSARLYEVSGYLGKMDNDR